MNKKDAVRMLLENRVKAAPVAKFQEEEVEMPAWGDKLSISVTLSDGTEMSVNPRPHDFGYYYPVERLRTPDGLSIIEDDESHKRKFLTGIRMLPLRPTELVGPMEGARQREVQRMWPHRWILESPQNFTGMLNEIWSTQRSMIKRDEQGRKVLDAEGKEQSIPLPLSAGVRDFEALFGPYDPRDEELKAAVGDPWYRGYDPEPDYPLPQRVGYTASVLNAQDTMDWLRTLINIHLTQIRGIEFYSEPPRPLPPRQNIIPVIEAVEESIAKQIMAAIEGAVQTAYAQCKSYLGTAKTEVEGFMLAGRTELDDERPHIAYKEYRPADRPLEPPIIAPGIRYGYVLDQDGKIVRDDTGDKGLPRFLDPMTVPTKIDTINPDTGRPESITVDIPPNVMQHVVRFGMELVNLNNRAKSIVAYFAPDPEEPTPRLVYGELPGCIEVADWQTRLTLRRQSPVMRAWMPREMLLLLDDTLEYLQLMVDRTHCIPGVGRTEGGREMEAGVAALGRIADEIEAHAHHHPA